MKILWANPHSLLDTSSGASISAREMLRQLRRLGDEVYIYGATIFDSASGISRFGDNWPNVQEKVGNFVTFKDDELEHVNLVTKSISRSEMTAHEEGLWYGRYCGILDEINPDVVMFYGGQVLDLLISDAAKERKIPSIAYLVNPNYSGSRWCRDVDLIITDTQATAQKYREELGYNVRPVGTFIDTARAVAAERHPKNVTFINPSLEKGAGFVVQLAAVLQEINPNIVIEVVESRGNWDKIRDIVLPSIGYDGRQLDNVKITPNTPDMRPIYARSKLLLVPSFWWDSGPRVIPEALANGIPVITSDYGGCPEVIGTGGFKIKFPDSCHKAPYTSLPSLNKVRDLASYIDKLFSDESLYRIYSNKAKESFNEIHSIRKNSKTLRKLISNVIKRPKIENKNIDNQSGKLPN